MKCSYSISYAIDTLLKNSASCTQPPLWARLTLKSPLLYSDRFSINTKQDFSVARYPFFASGIPFKYCSAFCKYSSFPVTATCAFADGKNSGLAMASVTGSVHCDTRKLISRLFPDPKHFFRILLTVEDIHALLSSILFIPFHQYL